MDSDAIPKGLFWAILVVSEGPLGGREEGGRGLYFLKIDLIKSLL